jgi:hypothetical protein
MSNFERMTIDEMLAVDLEKLSEEELLALGNQSEQLEQACKREILWHKSLQEGEQIFWPSEEQAQDWATNLHALRERCKREARMRMIAREEPEGERQQEIRREGREQGDELCPVCGPRCHVWIGVERMEMYREGLIPRLACVECAKE